MSDEQEQTFEETVNAFYPVDESEPLEAPTGEAAKDDQPEEIEEESADADESSKESEEEAGDGEEDKGDEEGDILVYDINGKEYTAKDIENLEAGQLMQADYTKKTQVLAEDRKKLDGDVTLLSEAITKTNDLAEQLEVLVGEDKEVNWSELKEDDPDEYIRLKERADNRKSKLGEVKANNQTSESSNVDVTAERVKLVEANPHWVDDKGKPTQAYSDEMKAIDDYYKEGDWTAEQMKRVAESAKLVQLVIDDVKRKASTEDKAKKTATARKKIKATPKTGKSMATQSNLSQEEIFYGKK